LSSLTPSINLGALNIRSVSKEALLFVVLNHSKYQPWGHKHSIGKQRSITIGYPHSLLASTSEP
jgi:hypothetical protein